MMTKLYDDILTQGGPAAFNTSIAYRVDHYIWDGGGGGRNYNILLPLSCAKMFKTARNVYNHVVYIFQRTVQ